MRLGFEMRFIAIMVVFMGGLFSFDSIGNTFKKAMGDSDLKKTPKTLSLLEKKVLTWHRMQLPSTPFSAVELFDFIEKNPKWPAIQVLRRQAERKIGSALPHDQVIAWFEKYPPLSSDGYDAYIEALLAQDESQTAIRYIKQAWHQSVFLKENLKRFYEKYKDVLSEEDHLKRIELLALAGKKEALQHLSPYLSASLRSFVKGILLLMEEKHVFEKGVSFIPGELSSHPLLYFYRFKSYLANNRMGDALALFEGIQAHGIDKNHPKAWLPLRLKLARALKESGQYQKAYNVLIPYHLPLDAATSHVDWFAGWIAYHHLKEYAAAHARFEAMYHAVKTPISTSKALYWMGKSLMKMGRFEEAESAFEEGAKFAYTYYGQESAKELNKKTHLPLKSFKITQKKLGKEWHEFGEIIQIFKKNGLTSLLKTFLFHIAEQAKTKDECDYVIFLTKKHFSDHTVLIAKLVGRQHSVDMIDAYPLLAALMKDKIEFDRKVMLHSLIRQESGFNTKNKSPVGAEGLMQLMPETAQYVFKLLFPNKKSKKQNLKDPQTNLLLGTHYFDRIMETFEGNLPLALAAYNAGPKRAKTWMEAWGVPGQNGVILNEWIENIPYEETRSYICRILEALPLYKELLLEKGKASQKSIPNLQK